MRAVNLEAIRTLDFFEPLDDKILRSVAGQCFDKEFNTGDFIIHQGEPGLGLYFILSGRARVEVENGGARTVVAELGANDSVGELSIVDDKVRSASVICTEPATCLLLTRDSFSKLMNKHPQIAIHMVRALAERLRATNARVVQSPAPAPSPVAGELRPKSKESSACDGFSAFSLPGKIFDAYRGTKDQVKDLLLNAFMPIYAARTMTRFSMAVIGCPVNVQSASPAFGVTVDDVKVFFFPHGRHQILDIDAYGDGALSIAVLRPGLGASYLRTAVRRNDRLRLNVSPGRIPRGGDIWMEAPNGERIGSDDRG
jgi:CRP-like cAMP-binding protein